MLTSERYPGCFLVGPKDLAADSVPDAIRDHRSAFEEIVRWAENYLGQPHPELGRKGPVCPFARPSMRKRLFYLTVQPGADLDPESVRSTMLHYRNWFLELEPRNGDACFKTILVLFPDLPRSVVPSLIDSVQEELKTEYVEKGLMIGEFHDGPPPKAGLWNPDFRPLNSPVPMLVIRHMVPTDFGFLKSNRDFLQAYLERFGDEIPGAIEKDVEKAALDWGLVVAG